MKTANNPPPEANLPPARGTKEKRLAIFLIALSIVGLLATPAALRWLILLEGLLGIAGILLFIYARMLFWREVKNRMRD